MYCIILDVPKQLFSLLGSAELGSIDDTIMVMPGELPTPFTM